MFELVFHKKEIPQRAGVGPHRVEQDRSGGGGDHQKFPRGFGARGEGYFRISAFNRRENAEEVAQRLQKL